LPQFLLGNHVLCPPNQAKKSVEGFGLKSNRRRTSFEQSIAGIKREISKPIRSLDCALISL
jgi:hypothetical protein